MSTQDNETDHQLPEAGTRHLLRQMQVNPAYTKASPAAIRRFGLATDSPLLDLLPPTLSHLALQLPPDQLEMTEEELERLYPPARHDRRLKAAFWDEFERAARALRQVDTTTLTQGTGLTSWELYLNRLQGNPPLACWFLTPPVHYRVHLKEAMALSMNRLMDVLELPLVDAKGRPNTGVGLLILQAVKFLDARIHGAITQKQIQVSVQDNHHGTELPDGSTARLDMRAIDSRIAELEQQMLESSLRDPAQEPAHIQHLPSESTSIPNPKGSQPALEGGPRACISVDSEVVGGPSTSILSPKVMEVVDDDSEGPY